MNEYDQLAEDDLLIRLQSEEDSFVEKKANVYSDVIRKTAVAFANTVQWPNEGVIFVGVEDRTGRPTGNLGNTEQKQKEIRGQIDKCFPPIPYYIKVIKVDGHDVIAVVITESPCPPHFTGKAYVRKGAESCEASDDLLQELVEERLGKVRELRKWKNKVVTVSREDMLTADRMGQLYREEGTLTEVTSHWIRWEVITSELDSRGEEGEFSSVPLEYIKMFWDKYENRLHIIVPDFPTRA